MAIFVYMYIFVCVLLHTGPTLLCVNISLSFNLTRVKSKDDAVTELSDTPELIQDPNVIRHPSLTVAFTLKVSLGFHLSALLFFFF